VFGTLPALLIATLVAAKFYKEDFGRMTLELFVPPFFRIIGWLVGQPEVRLE
jgi:hypothetical protein